MPKGVPNKRYTPEFKKLVIETMQEEKLSYSETCRRFEVNSRDRIKSWERIYLEEGPEGFAVERRGRSRCGTYWCTRSGSLCSRRSSCLCNCCTSRQMPPSRTAGGRRFEMRAVSSGLRHPASASCLGRHARLAGRCPNNSSLFPPLAAVVVVAAEELFIIN